MRDPTLSLTKTLTLRQTTDALSLAKARPADALPPTSPWRTLRPRAPRVVPAVVVAPAVAVVVVSLAHIALAVARIAKVALSLPLPLAVAMVVPAAVTVSLSRAVAITVSVTVSRAVTVAVAIAVAITVGHGGRQVCHSNPNRRNLHAEACIGKTSVGEDTDADV